MDVYTDGQEKLERGGRPIGFEKPAESVGNVRAVSSSVGYGRERCPAKHLNPIYPTKIDGSKTETESAIGRECPRPTQASH